MKYFVIGAFTLAIIMWFFAITSHASESLLGQIFVDFSTGEATYTEHNDFSQSYGVKTSVTVENNICNFCIANFNPDQCLEACQSIVIEE